MSFHFDWNRLDATSSEAIRLLLNAKLADVVLKAREKEELGTGSENKLSLLEYVEVTDIRWGSAPPFIELVNFEDALPMTPESLSSTRSVSTMASYVGAPNGGGLKGNAFGALGNHTSTSQNITLQNTPARTPITSDFAGSSGMLEWGMGSNSKLHNMYDEPTVRRGPLQFPSHYANQSSQGQQRGGTDESNDAFGSSRLYPTDSRRASQSRIDSPDGGVSSGRADVSPLSVRDKNNGGTEQRSSISAGAASSSCEAHGASGARNGVKARAGAQDPIESNGEGQAAHRLDDGKPRPLSFLKPLTSVANSSADLNAGRYGSATPSLTSPAAIEVFYDDGRAPVRSAQQSMSYGPRRAANSSNYCSSAFEPPPFTGGPHANFSNNPFPDRRGRENAQRLEADSLAPFVGPGGLYLRFHLTYGGALEMSVSCAVRKLIDVCGMMKVSARLPLEVTLFRLGIDCYLNINLHHNKCCIWLDPGSLSTSPITRLSVRACIGTNAREQFHSSTQREAQGGRRSTAQQQQQQQQQQRKSSGSRGSGGTRARSTADGRSLGSAKERAKRSQSALQPWMPPRRVCIEENAEEDVYVDERTATQLVLAEIRAVLHRKLVAPHFVSIPLNLSSKPTGK